MTIILKFLHITGVVVFLGDIIITTLWKWRADRTREGAVAAFAQRQLLLADRMLLQPAVTLIVVSGLAMGQLGSSSAWNDPRMLAAQVTFIGSGAIWFLVLRPLQARQMTLASAFQPGEPTTIAYEQLTRRWLVWGGVAIALSLGAMFFMVQG